MPNVKRTIQAYFRFCPHCGRRTKLQRVHGTQELSCPACGYTFWMNSKPTASVLLVQRGKVLLTRRAIQPYRGYWDAPGGYLDIHEMPVQGLQREMREELSIRIVQPKLLGVYLGLYPSTPLQSTFNVYYVATRFTGKLKAQDDVASYAWHPIEHLPKRIAFANNRQALRDLTAFLQR